MKFIYRGLFWAAVFFCGGKARSPPAAAGCIRMKWVEK